MSIQKSHKVSAFLFLSSHRTPGPLVGGLQPLLAVGPALANLLVPLDGLSSRLHTALSPGRLISWMVSQGFQLAPNTGEH